MNPTERDLLKRNIGLAYAVEILRGTLSKVMHNAPGYDWNADPLSLTALTSTAFSLANEVLGDEP